MLTHPARWQAVGAQYPAALNRAIFKHMTEVEGEADVVTLARSAWAGSQRWGVAMWSGDVRRAPSRLPPAAALLRRPVHASASCSFLQRPGTNRPK